MVGGKEVVEGGLRAVPEDKVDIAVLGNQVTIMASTRRRQKDTSPCCKSGLSLRFNPADGTNEMLARGRWLAGRIWHERSYSVPRAASVSGGRVPAAGGPAGRALRSPGRGHHRGAGSVAPLLELGAPAPAGVGAPCRWLLPG